MLVAEQVLNIFNNMLSDRDEIVYLVGSSFSLS